MALDKKLFPCRIDELGVFGGYLQISLVRDEANFAPYLDFGGTYPADFLTKLGIVREAIMPEVFIKQMKVLTKTLLENSYGLRLMLNSAEIFFNSAGSGLDVLPADMGQRAVRAAVTSDDVEDVLLSLAILNANIARNSAILISKGMLLPIQTAFVTATTTITNANNSKNSMIGVRNAATNGNMILFNDFWAVYVSPTRTTGALIFKILDKAKYKDYVIAQMIARSRHDEAQTQVHGRITDALGNPLDKVKVKLIPVAGGRTRTVYTDAEGNYVASGMVATAYNQVVTKGALVKINPLDVVTRVHLELNTVLG